MVPQALGAKFIAFQLEIIFFSRIILTTISLWNVGVHA